MPEPVQLGSDERTMMERPIHQNRHHVSKIRMTETATCIRCSIKFFRHILYGHGLNVCTKVDRLMGKRSTITSMKCVFRQLEGNKWIDDVCASCWIEMVKSYVNKDKSLKPPKQSKRNFHYKDWYQTNKEAIKKYKKDWYQTNKDRIKRVHRAYRFTNKDRIQKRRRISVAKRQYGDWAPVWLTRQQLMREVRNHGERIKNGE